MNKIGVNQKEQGSVNFGLTICVGLSLLCVISLISVRSGAMNLSFKDVIDAILNFNPDDMQHLAIIDMRLPRVIASALVGGAFAVSGAMMQGITRNPMADSGLMGLNAGAALALSMCFAFLKGISYLYIIILSFLGATLGALLVNGIAAMRRGGATPLRMVLAGVAVSALLSSISQGIALHFHVSKNLMFWTAGGVAASTWEQIRIMLPWILSAFVGAIMLSRSITLLSLGEDVAKGLGLNTGLIKLLASGIVLMLAGASVAVVGSVGFVGLIVPHFARYLVGVDYRYIIPASAILGALLIVCADLLARTINAPFEAPLGVLIALLGVPFFIYLSRKEKGGL